MNLKNFETNIPSVILKRGQEYFSNGNITSSEEVADGKWFVEVEGSDTYIVELIINVQFEIVNYTCDCPYDGDICKHVVAELFSLRNELAKLPVKLYGNKNKDLFEGLLAAVSHIAYQNFVRQYVKK